MKTVPNMHNSCLSINYVLILFFRFWSRIPSGGHISAMMASCGTWTTTAQTWSRPWVVWRVFLNTPSSKELTSPHGRVCFGRRPVALKNPWSTRNWPMLSDLGWIRFQTEDLHFGGHQPLTELMYVIFRTIFDAITSANNFSGIIMSSCYQFSTVQGLPDLPCSWSWNVSKWIGRVRKQTDFKCLLK